MKTCSLCLAGIGLALLTILMLPSAQSASAQDGFFDGVFDLSNLNGTNGFVINGIDPSDAAGVSVSRAGDLNSDGVDDIVVAANFADPSGNGEAGESYVVFGSAGGFSASLDLSSLDGTNGFVINGIDADDNSGISVSGAGDVNNDGVDDIIVGADAAAPSGNSSAGESYVVFGSAGGFSASLDLSTLDGTNGFVINGIDPGDFSGKSVSGAGDVNGDGVGDIIVGARGADPGGDSSAGESYVVFGSGGGFSASLDLSSLNGTSGFVINGIDPSDNSGVSVNGAGDLNGDGVDDIIIGANFADAGGNSFAGESYVVFGSAGGFSASLDLSSLDGTSGFVIHGIDPSDNSGISVSGAGDLNGDGVDDIIIGANQADPGGNGGAGESYVVFGSAGGFSASLDLSTLDGTSGFVINGIDPFDNSGISVSGAGDVNGDGVDDIIIGAEEADPAGNTSAGESYVVFGSAGGFSASLDLSSLDGTGGFVVNGIDPVDNSGISVSGAGDVNGDGVGDIIVGASDANPGGNSGAGESYVVFGVSGFTWTPLAGGNFDTDTNWLGSSPGATGGVIVIQPQFGGTITGPGGTVIADRLTLGAALGTATLDIPAGGLVVVNDTATIETSGRLTGDGTFVAKEANFTVEGTIDLGAASLQVIAENTLTNNGTIEGSGIVDVGGTLTNNGLIQGSGEFNVAGSMTNDGTIRVAAGQNLSITAGVQVHNAADVMDPAQIDLLGGTLQIAGFFNNGIIPINLFGEITGHGTLIVEDGMNNARGTMAFSGDTNVLGDVTNNDTIINSGNSTLTFFDDVDHQGTEIRTSTGSTTVFFGDVTGPGPYTGSGTVFYEGTFSPGSSPAAVSIAADAAFGSGSLLEIELGGLTAGDEYDRLTIGGTAALDGTLLVSLIDDFRPQVGDEFEILTYGALDGEFDEVQFAGPLDGTLNYGPSSLTLSITAVPEPSSVVLLLIAIAAIVARTRIR